MKLIYEITTLDDKTKVYKCIDFASWGSDFVTFYMKNFIRENIKTSTILRSKQYFKI